MTPKMMNSLKIQRHYNCLFNNGTLLLVGDGSDNEPLDYVSPESSWYSDYEQGKSK